MKWVKESNDKFVCKDKFPNILVVTKKWDSNWYYHVLNFENSVLGKGLCGTPEYAMSQAEKMIKLKLGA